ncbi:hypothetical protein [Actinomadura sp. 3N508]|uniref:hypothetical protein n=1 Tax=Actinomadura sp. 3N508 TaxID=3375153 RepID=UPI0037A9F33B
MLMLPKTGTVWRGSVPMNSTSRFLRLRDSDERVAVLLGTVGCFPFGRGGRLLWRIW